MKSSAELAIFYEGGRYIGDLYNCNVDGHDLGYVGKSPDEALGYAVRELILAETGDTITISVKLLAPA